MRHAILALLIAARALAADEAALLAELTARAPERTVVIRPKGKPDGPISRIFGDLFDGQPGNPAATAKAFLEKYGVLLGFPEGAVLPPELELEAVPSDDRGHIVKLTPARKKVPYPSGVVQLTVLASGKLVAATGRYRKLENVQEGSLKAGDAVKRALSELAKKFPGAWLSSDGTLTEYLADGPGGTIRHVYDMQLNVGDRQLARHIVLGPGGEVLDEEFGGEERDATGLVHVGYPLSVPAPVPLKDLDFLSSWISGKHFMLIGEYFEPYGAAPARARAKNGYFWFPVHIDDEFRDTDVRIPDSRFLETHVYHHLTVAREKALAWGATQVDNTKVPFDVWVLPKDPLDGLHNDNAFFRPANSSLNFAIWNPGKGFLHPAFDISVIYHEYGHYVRRAVNPKAHEGGTQWQRWNARAVNEGFADFFSSQITGQDHEGKRWKPDRFRSTVEDVKYCQIAPAYARDKDPATGDKKPKPANAKAEIHEAGKCFSRLCNDLKAIVGDEIGPMLIRATRNSKNPATFENMCDALLTIELMHNDGKRFSRMYHAMIDREIYANDCPDPEDEP